MRRGSHRTATRWSSPTSDGRRQGEPPRRSVRSKPATSPAPCSSTWIATSRARPSSRDRAGIHFRALSGSRRRSRRQGSGPRIGSSPTTTPADRSPRGSGGCSMRSDARARCSTAGSPPGPLRWRPVRSAVRTPAEVDVRPWPAERVIDADGVAEALRAGDVVLDARAPERYRGEREPIDPVAGHIPGARSAPFAEVVGSDGRFRSPDALRERFEDLGVSNRTVPIAYCGSGVTASLDVFALRLAGLGNARLFEGSWSDWVHDPARPVATGEEP
jgi:rhodanese-related sulfurtransferase